MSDVGARLDMLRGQDCPPRINGELVFEAPWHSRAFAMATSLAERGIIDWDQFREQLSSQIASTNQRGVDEYYGCWTRALETLLLDDNLLEGSSVDTRAHEFTQHARDEVF